MAKNLNRCQFIGRLGADPEGRAMPDGTAVTKFRIAVADDYKDRNSGQKKEKTEWVPIVSYGRVAEICAQFLKKGSKVYVEGRFETRTWDDAGTTRYVTEIRLENMEMLDSKGSNDSQAAPPQSAGRSPRPAATRQPAAASGSADYDDDLPF